MASRRSLVPPANETRISLGEAVGVLQARGTSVSLMTIWRWSTKGKSLPGGGRVFLEHERVGRKIRTTPESLSRFIERTTEQSWIDHQPGLAVN
jgi:hypothetical protein